MFQSLIHQGKNARSTITPSLLRIAMRFQSLIHQGKNASSVPGQAGEDTPLDCFNPLFIRGKMQDRSGIRKTCDADYPVFQSLIHQGKNARDTEPMFRQFLMK